MVGYRLIQSNKFRLPPRNTQVALGYGVLINGYGLTSNAQDKSQLLVTMYYSQSSGHEVMSDLNLMVGFMVQVS